MPRPSHRSPRLTRRRFLGLAGAALSGAACGGSALGWLALDWLRGETLAAPAPAPTPTRSAQVKVIERPPIVLRADWGAREPNHDAANETGFYSLTNVEGWREYEGDLRAIYRTVVVHHSVVYETDDSSTMREIQHEHMDDRQWADIGYHFAVGRSGEVFEGRDLMARGTHVETYNSGSVGVVFLGNFEVDYATPEQIEAGRQLIDWLALRLELTHLAGHDEFNDFTECPGAHLLPYLDPLADSAGLQRGTDGYEPPPEQLITPTPNS